MILAVAAITGSGVVWVVFWAAFGLTALAIGLATLLMIMMSGAIVRWIEFSPGEDATRLMIMRLLPPPTTIAVADLERVVALDKSTDQRKTIVILLHMRAGVESTHGAHSIFAPFSRIDIQTVLGWLSSQLAPAQVPVEYRKDADRDLLCPDEWWTDADLAKLWQVPVSDVEELTARHDIRSCRYEPRATASSSAGDRTVTVYDPARALEVTAEVRG